MKKTGPLKVAEAAVVLAVGTIALAGAVNVKFDPKKGLSLQALSVSVDVPKASANCSDNHSGSGNCVC